MSETELIIQQKKISGNFGYEVKVRKVPPSPIYPDGYKINCALWLIEEKRKILILDAHEPFGTHLHPEPETNHDLRISVPLKDPIEVVEYFSVIVNRILSSADYKKVIQEVVNEANQYQI